MMGNVNATIKTNVRQVEETYMSVLNIQRSMVQLNQMFMDLAYLVNEQGENALHWSVFSNNVVLPIRGIECRKRSSSIW